MLTRNDWIRLFEYINEDNIELTKKECNELAEYLKQIR
jgi:hypothetical protein